MKDPDDVVFWSIRNLGEVSIQDRVTIHHQLHNEFQVLGCLSQVFDL